MLNNFFYMYLNEIEQNTFGKIIKIYDEKSILIKLSSMGISKNTVFAMVKNNFKGAVILKIDNNKIILGRGLCKKIEVELL
ncbi:MAG: hypothetical protein A2888_03530 [Chlamydiae bacterium RIFCSPLOWO2_01_FULL_28_7]|nr:MAG: hypothetical protein A2888_03530 [Chlamydiae bacterium RIFCSPLOWO2_01_FULL_28_7]